MVAAIVMINILSGGGNVTIFKIAARCACEIIA
jgi:hypothetical protein